MFYVRRQNLDGAWEFWYNYTWEGCAATAYEDMLQAIACCEMASKKFPGLMFVVETATKEIVHKTLAALENS